MPTWGVIFSIPHGPPPPCDQIGMGFFFFWSEFLVRIPSGIAEEVHSAAERRRDTHGLIPGLASTSEALGCMKLMGDIRCLEAKVK